MPVSKKIGIAYYAYICEDKHSTLCLPSTIKASGRAYDVAFLVDAALRNVVLLRGEEILSDSDEMGRVVETSVLRHLYAYYYLDTPRVTYWREPKTDKEVDVIVKSPKYVIPVEVKYRHSAKLSAKDGLVKYTQNDDNVQYGYMVTKSERDFDVLTFQDVSARFLKVPAHIFIYLLGQAEHSLWEQAGRKTSDH